MKQSGRYSGRGPEGPIARSVLGLAHLWERPAPKAPGEGPATGEVVRAEDRSTAPRGHVVVVRVPLSLAPPVRSLGVFGRRSAMLPKLLTGGTSPPPASGGRASA